MEDKIDYYGMQLIATAALAACPITFLRVNILYN